MKLLIIEDNHLLASSLKELLQPTFTVDIASSGRDGIEHTTKSTYAMIILDLNLPDMDGQDVCRTLRQQHVTAPILIATAEKDPARCVALLDGGADDYVTKPYDMAIIQARIRALLRRHAPNETNIIQVKDLKIDTGRRHVERRGKPIKLRKKEFEILTYLAQNKGRAVTRPMILDNVWESGKDSWNNTVDVHIKYLRDKIDKPFEDPLIKTAHGVGYMLDD